MSASPGMLVLFCLGDDVVVTRPRDVNVCRSCLVELDKAVICLACKGDGNQHPDMEVIIGKYIPASLPVYNMYMAKNKTDVEIIIWVGSKTWEDRKRIII